MKECDILGVKTYCDPHIFSGCQYPLNPFMISASNSTAVRQAFDCFSKIVKGRTCLTSCRWAAATICPRPGLQVVTRYTSCIRIWKGDHYCMPMLACQYNQPKRSGDLDLVTLKVVSQSRVTWATSVPILVFLYRPLCSRLRSDVRDRQTDVRQKHRLMPQPIRGGGMNSNIT